MKFLNTGLINDLSTALNVSSLKNKVIAENIANIDTPGYKSKNIDFKKAMQEYFSGGQKLSLKTTDEKHIKSSGSSAGFINTEFRNSPSLRNDGNDVNIDLEMYELSANGVLYSELSQLTGYQFTKLKTAITGR
ncbi:flagellar basal body rod protein FlgB [Deferribacterales bacterium Es71-Z0220]|jgi:flagellar basal-body rod protein FlgB|uniref:flagellar basal body rod protein FlgB n=1 Tax=Deferrivibrio essentukiensis TaxID=2880922 RepID=UPI001F60D648|nr:flagellar basal body rod protein FlgB [Deferrivibrio essentukiensis]MCB4203752.1 flagellar basal body rod protein FlgB [Deferrivibrio essentukiensis]